MYLHRVFQRCISIVTRSHLQWKCNSNLVNYRRKRPFKCLAKILAERKRVIFVFRQDKCGLDPPNNCNRNAMVIRLLVFLSFLFFFSLHIFLSFFLSFNFFLFFLFILPSFFDVCVVYRYEINNNSNTIHTQIQNTYANSGGLCRFRYERVY